MVQRKLLTKRNKERLKVEFEWVELSEWSATMWILKRLDSIECMVWVSWRKWCLIVLDLFKLSWGCVVLCSPSQISVVSALWKIISLFIVRGSIWCWLVRINIIGIYKWFWYFRGVTLILIRCGIFLFHTLWRRSILIYICHLICRLIVLGDVFVIFIVVLIKKYFNNWERRERVYLKVSFYW